MRYALLVLVFSASTASAQTVEATLDMTALGWGPLSLPQLVETDGDLSTTEWLLTRPSTTRILANEMRVVAERNGTLCAGEWFAAVPIGALSSVQRRGLTHVLVVKDGTSAKIVRLDTPVCN